MTVSRPVAKTKMKTTSGSGEKSVVEGESAVDKKEDSAAEVPKSLIKENEPKPLLRKDHRRRVILTASQKVLGPSAQGIEARFGSGPLP